jgi:thioredoxin 2
MTAGSSAIVECPVRGRRNRVPAAASGVPRCGRCHSPLPWTTAADDGSYHAVVDGAALPVLVDLWARLDEALTKSRRPGGSMAG